MYGSTKSEHNSYLTASESADLFGIISIPHLMKPCKILPSKYENFSKLQALEVHQIGLKFGRF